VSRWAIALRGLKARREVMRDAAMKRRSSTLLIACVGLVFLGSNYAQNLGFRL
jgi:hypothetical protein